MFHNTRRCKDKQVYNINQTICRISFGSLHYLTFREKKTMDYALITMNFFVSLQTKHYINIIIGSYVMELNRKLCATRRK